MIKPIEIKPEEIGENIIIAPITIQEPLLVINKCYKLPAGWTCSREEGHSGPCHASIIEFVQAKCKRCKRNVDCGDELCLRCEDYLSHNGE